MLAAGIINAGTLAKWLLEFLGIPRKILGIPRNKGVNFHGKFGLGIPRNSNSENQWLSLKSCKSKKFLGISGNFWEFLGMFKNYWEF